MEVISGIVSGIKSLLLRESKGGKSIEMSVGKSKVICGYRIRKMHFGAWLEATKRIENLPKELSEALFPGKNLDEILSELSGIDVDSAWVLVSTAMTKVPELVIDVVSEVSEISSDELMNNPDIGIGGIMSIIEAVIEVNELGEFTASLKKVWTMTKK